MRFIGVGIQERAVRVETAQRALDRAVDQLLGRHLVDVLVLYDRQHLGEQPQLFVRGSRVGAFADGGAAE